MLLQEERRIGRGMNCGSTGESWYPADDGRGAVERELRLQWLKACRGVLRPLSIPPPAGHGLAAGRSSCAQCSGSQ